MPNIKKNFIYQSAYQLLLVLIPLALAPYISRVLGAEKIGIYSYTDSIAKYFVMFSMLGISHQGSRTIAADRGNKTQLNKTFSDLLFLHLFVSVIICIVYSVYYICFVKEYKIYFAIQFLVVLSALFDINWLFIGLEQFKLAVIRSSLTKITAVLCVFIFVKSPDDLWKFTLIMAAGTFAPNAILWFFLRRFVSLGKPSWNGIKSHIKPVVILFIPVIAISVYNVMDKVMLGAMTDKIQLGFYTNSEKIILIPLGFITAFNAVMIPRMSSINAAGDKTTQSKLILSSMKYVMLIAFALTFGIAGISSCFAPVFFGEEFRECGILIKNLCVIVPFLAFQNVITSQYLIPNYKDKTYMISTVAGAVINIIANLILIPRFQAMGAIIGTIFAESIRCIIVSIAAGKNLPIFSYIKNSVFFILPGTLMYFSVRYIAVLMGETVLTVIIQVVAGAALYLAVSASFLYITKDHYFIYGLIRFRNVLKKKLM